MTTANPPAEVDEDAFNVSRTITIAAPQEKVWQAITDPEHIVKWFGAKHTLDRLEPGGTGVWTFDGYGDIPILIQALEAPRFITYRWGDAGDAAPDVATSTTFTLTLTAIAGGTQLHVIETGFERLPNPARGMASNQEGWTSELDKLVALLGGVVEGGAV